MFNYITAVLLLLCAISAQAGVFVGFGQGGGSTDWTASANLEALYLLDGDGLDATSNDNDLSCANDPPCPSTDTTNKIEGSGSMVFTSAGTDASYYILQESMSTGFPANGTSTTALTIAGWIRPSLASEKQIWELHRANNSSSLRFSTTATLTLRVTVSGESSSSSTAALVDTTLSIGNWYFVATTYDGTDTCLYIREHGSGASAYTCATGATGVIDDIGSSGGVFALGARSEEVTSNAFYGNIDAVGVFTRAFSRAELEAVFANGWDGDGW